MSARGEELLMQHLTIHESMEILAHEGLDPMVVRTEELRIIYEWAMKQFHRGGRVKPASVAAIRTEWGDVLDDFTIDIEEEPEDTIELVIDDLKGSFIFREVQSFSKEFANEIATVDTESKVEVADRYATELVRLVVSMESHEFRSDVREGLHERLDAYQQRTIDRDTTYGMSFGLPMIDNYTRGIHQGELAVLAAGPKVGKSFFLCHVARKEWEKGRRVVFFTLENDVNMTLDRIACLSVGVPMRAWQAGTVDPYVVEKVQHYANEMRKSDSPLLVLQPGLGKRSVEHLVRQAQMEGAESLLIDQLSFLEVEDPRQRRDLQIRELTHTLKGLVSTGRHRMPVLLAHQINREGVKSAEKVGFLEMYHLAEGSSVEATSDWVFSLYRDRYTRSTLIAKFQTLASRREDTKHFQMQWEVGMGLIDVQCEISLDKPQEA